MVFGPWREWTNCFPVPSTGYYSDPKESLVSFSFQGSPPEIFNPQTVSSRRIFVFVPTAGSSSGEARTFTYFIYQAQRDYFCKYENKITRTFKYLVHTGEAHEQIKEEKCILQFQNLLIHDYPLILIKIAPFVRL